MATTVVHCKKDEYDIYIGRPSKWSNQFKIGQKYKGYTLTRELAIECYKDWLLYSNEGVALRVDIGELKDKTLGCWCKPLNCHGDFLALLADQVIKP